VLLSRPPPTQGCARLPYTTLFRSKRAKVSSCLRVRGRNSAKDGWAATWDGGAVSSQSCRRLLSDCITQLAFSSLAAAAFDRPPGSHAPYVLPRIAARSARAPGHDRATARDEPHRLHHRSNPPRSR